MMLNQRLAEITRRPDAPFAFAGSAYGSFVRSTDVYQLQAAAKDGAHPPGAPGGAHRGPPSRPARLPPRRTRSRAHGDAPLLRERQRRAGEDRVGELRGGVRRPVPHRRCVAGDRVGVCGGATPPPGDHPRRRERVGRARGSPSAIASSPSRPQRRTAPAFPPWQRSSPPSVRPTPLPVAAYTETVSSAALVASVPAPGRVVAESTTTEIGVTTWTLSNGARVVLKPTTFKADEVMMRGVEPGRDEPRRRLRLRQRDARHDRRGARWAR